MINNIFEEEFVDEYGVPCKRTKYEYPYSYDAFVLWKTDGVSNDTVYSDRLWQWDYVKHDKLCKKHFGDEGQRWNRRNPFLIEQFLRDWNDNQNLILIRIMEYCNKSNGFPLWRFDFSI